MLLHELEIIVILCMAYNDKNHVKEVHVMKIKKKRPN